MASCARAGKPFFAILKPSAAGACALSPSRPSRPLHPRISALLPVSPNYWARPKSVATLRVLPTSPNGWAWMGGLPTPLSPCAADSGLVPRALSPSRVSIYITRIYIHTTEAASALVRQPASATAPNSAGGEGRGGGSHPSTPIHFAIWARHVASSSCFVPPKHWARPGRIVGLCHVYVLPPTLGGATIRRCVSAVLAWWPSWVPARPPPFPSRPVSENLTGASASAPRACARCKESRRSTQGLL